MRDAVNLLEKTIIINGVTYSINSFYYVPDSCKIFLKLENINKTYVNVELVNLLSLFKEQIKL
jgi:hypothetical protein